MRDKIGDKIGTRQRQGKLQDRRQDKVMTRQGIIDRDICTRGLQDYNPTQNHEKSAFLLSKLFYGPSPVPLFCRSSRPSRWMPRSPPWP